MLKSCISAEDTNILITPKPAFQNLYVSTRHTQNPRKIKSRTRFIALGFSI